MNNQKGNYRNLVDEIRDMVRDARSRGMYPVLTDAAEDLLGRSCLSEDDEADLFTKIADRIEREYLPRPRFEDGEPVQFGDEVELHYKSGGCGKGIIQAFHANKGPVWMLSFAGNDHERLFRYDSTCDVLKRPEHEVLDADGVPIKVGDHVWWKDGREFVITAVNRGVDTEAVEPAPGMCSSHVNFEPKEFTHKQPDSLERTTQDVDEAWYDWGGNVFNDDELDDFGRFEKVYNVCQEIVEPIEFTCHVMELGGLQGRIPLLLCSACGEPNYARADGSVWDYCPSCGSRVIRNAD